MSTPITAAEATANELVLQVGTRRNLQIYPRSIARTGEAIYFLARPHQQKSLCILAAEPRADFDGETFSVDHDGRALNLKVCALNAANAAALRGIFAWLEPQVLGLKKSVGFGDRLGLATPGHIRALRACGNALAPTYAQQSIREMARTERTPLQVLDDAMWGVFQEGWREGFGADADHLKTEEHIDRCAAAGYTFYTFDPGAYVDDDLALDDQKLHALPWSELETSFADLRARYVGQRAGTREIDEATLRRALIKYGRAVAHVARLYRHLASTRRGLPFEVEISVDETATPTEPAEHFIVAGELRRLGVEWVSLAPRFVGRFEKGVDYIGDLDAFAADFAAHVAVAKHWGPYKLSLHSGSDKFSIYAIAAQTAGELVHLKTAGTSYLEALRTIARLDADLFRKIYALAIEHYAEDRASYHVSADAARAPRVEELSDSALVTCLDDFTARQMLHVCFGSILAQYGAEIHSMLAAHEEAYYADLEKHFDRHLENFCR